MALDTWKELVKAMLKTRALYWQAEQQEGWLKRRCTRGKP